MGCRDGAVVRALASHPSWLGFDSQTWRHMWIEFAGSLLCTERFSPGTPVSPLLKSQTFDIWLDLRLLFISVYCVPYSKPRDRFSVLVYKQLSQWHSVAFTLRVSHTKTHWNRSRLKILQTKCRLPVASCISTSLRKLSLFYFFLLLNTARWLLFTT